MLAIKAINGANNQLVYQVPTGKRAYVDIMVHSPISQEYPQFFINNSPFVKAGIGSGGTWRFSGLILDAGDTISVFKQVNTTVYIFVLGVEEDIA